MSDVVMVQDWNYGDVCGKCQKKCYVNCVDGNYMVFTENVQMNQMNFKYQLENLIRKTKPIAILLKRPCGASDIHFVERPTTFRLSKT